MKNRFLKYSIVAVIGLCLFSVACTDLEEETFDTIIAEQIDVSKLDPAVITGTAYIEFREAMWRWNGLFEANESCSDEIVISQRKTGAWGDNGNAYQLMHKHLWTPAMSGGSYQGIWAHLATGVLNCNKILKKIDEGSLNLGDETDQCVAEVKCMRALYHYLYCDIYGRAPIVTVVLSKDSIPPIKTRKEVYDFVVSELTENASKLSNQTGGKSYTRMNKWAAYTLLAKMYLNAEVYSGTAEWQKCIDICDTVFKNSVENGGVFELVDDYSAPFLAKNENCKESILNIAFTDESGAWDNAMGFFYMQYATLHPANQETYNMGDQPWNGMSAIPQFIDSYDTADLRLKKTWIMGQQYSSSGDSLYCTLEDVQTGKPLAFKNYYTDIMGSLQDEGYRVGKYEIEKGTKNRCAENDWVYFRFADIYMMKAEALLRTGKADEAAVLVSKVRERAYKDPAKATVTGAQLQGNSVYQYGLYNKGVVTPDNTTIEYGRMLDELGWEFACEGRRRQDLIRFGVFTKNQWFYHEPQGDYRNLYPIPRSISIANGYSQNEGYVN